MTDPVFDLEGLPWEEVDLGVWQADFQNITFRAIEVVWDDTCDPPVQRAAKEGADELEMFWQRQDMALPEVFLMGKRMVVYAEPPWRFAENGDEVQGPEKPILASKP